MAKKKLRRETIMISGGWDGDEKTGSLAVPIFRTAAYAFKNTEHARRLFAGEQEGFVYSRINNPTVDILEKRMALAEGGEAGLAASSGMAAIMLLAIHLAKNGGEIVSSDRLYGGTFNLFNKTLAGLGIKTRFVGDPHQIDSWAAAITQNTRLLYVETPSNPTLDIMEIRPLAALARRRSIPLAVDNTVATPALQNPLKLGADIVVHSLTKYIAGNGSDVGGIIIGKKDLIDRMRAEEYRDLGPCLHPEAAWLFLLGMETLTLRMRKHCQNALKVAKFLKNHPKVLKVNYPGLPDHQLYVPGKKQMKGFGGLLSFEIKGSFEQATKFIEALTLCRHVANLGDSKTLAIHPASTTHEQLGTEGRKRAKIMETMIRMSIGLEDAADIIADIESALEII